MHPWEKMKFKSLATRPGSLSLINTFEQSVGAKLPSDFRQFLLAVNGGRPVHLTKPNPRDYALVEVDWQGRPPAEAHDLVIVSYLLSAEDWAGIYEEEKGDSLTLDGAYRVFVQEEPRIPGGFIPIGKDPGGSLFLLDVGGKQLGSVWFWARDWFNLEQKEESPFHNMGLVAANFSEFISKIQFKPIS